MALLERGELLERERVHPAELGELALGRGEALLLLLAVERHGLDSVSAVSSASGCRRRLVVASRSAIVDRDRDLGAVLGDQHVLDQAELAARPLEQARQVQLLLVDLQLEAVHALGDRLQPLAQRVLLAAQAGELLVLLARSASAVASSTRAWATERSTESSTAGSASSTRGRRRRSGGGG